MGASTTVTHEITDRLSLWVKIGLLSTGLMGAPSTWAADDDAYAAQRVEMVELIRDQIARVQLPVQWAGPNATVLRVMESVPRHEFVPSRWRSFAYHNRPLPIGHGQTISQPFIVALMTDLLDLASGDTALEVGTGSGYQAAILADLVERVCSIEIIPELGVAAANRLSELGYDNVRTRISDGYYGWPECGPFDAIIVTAASSHIPPPLIEQLKPGGRIVIPVGGPFVVQHLVLVEKSPGGRITTRQILPVVFVPLLRDAS